MKLDPRIEHWDDERTQGNGIIVTLRYGWSFEEGSHEGIRGFDTAGEARKHVKLFATPCSCQVCKDHLKSA